MLQHLLRVRLSLLVLPSRDLAALGVSGDVYPLDRDPTQDNHHTYIGQWSVRETDRSRAWAATGGSPVSAPLSACHGGGDPSHL
jgi:hypothetical protein